MSFRLRIKARSREKPAEQSVGEIWVRFNAPHGKVLFSAGALATMGVGPGDRIEVLVGEGEDVGRIAFRVEEEGQGYKLSAHASLDIFALLRGLQVRGSSLTVPGEMREGLLVVDSGMALQEAESGGARKG